MRQTIEKLINSDISAYQIQKETGVNESAIRHLRKGRRKLGGLTLDTAEKLYDYAVILGLDKDTKIWRLTYDYQT